MFEKLKKKERWPHEAFNFKDNEHEKTGIINSYWHIDCARARIYHV